jgi:predicted nucleic acid-binding protein
MTEPKTMQCAIDTNILVYAEGFGDELRCTQAATVLARLNPKTTVLPVQVLGELCRVLTAKAKRDATQVRTHVLQWTQLFPTAPTQASALLAAMDLTAERQVPTWDAIILAVAADQGCRWLLSEDYADGMTYRGVTVLNPFTNATHPALQVLQAS